MEELISLLGALHNATINGLAPDQLKCGDSRTGEFSVKVANKLLCPQNAITAFWPWEVKLLPKTSCFS